MLDCYNDRAYEDADFESGERWIAKRLDEVLVRYATAYKRYTDSNPPPPSGGVELGRMELPKLGSKRSPEVPDRNQLVLQLS